MIKRFITGLILGLVLTLGLASSVQAGTDLTVTCPNFGSCSVSPASTPLLDESGWVPGSTVTQQIQVTNTSGDDGFVGIEVDNYTELKDLGEIIEINIREGSPVGTVIYGPVTAYQFRDDGFFTIDAINASQTIDYFLTAEMPTSAGNKYQASSLKFDLNLGLEITPIVPPSGGGDGTGSTSPASPPVCNATAPSSAPAVTITGTGTNTVSLSWTAVSPVTHYALVFTRSDGEQYGSTNIGNVTSYTVNNLSGGFTYTFEVFGVNDCAPGDRGSAGTGILAGPVVEGRPTGPGGEVLGVDEEEPSPSPAPIGEVEGAATCEVWRQYLPLIILGAQFLLIMLLEYLRRKKQGLGKLLMIAVLTLLSIGIFYWLRDCNCYDSNSIWTLLCSWYWVAAVGVTLLLRVFSYAFVEEVEV